MRDLVIEIIERLTAKHGIPPTFQEIYREITRQGRRISERWLRELLRRLVNDGYLEVLRTRPMRYRVARRPPPIRSLLEFIGRMETSEEFSGKIELEEESLEETVAGYIIHSIEEQRQIMNDITANWKMIASADPRKELVELARFLCISLYKTLEAIDLYIDDPKKRSIYEKRLKLIRQIVDRYYASVLGVPVDYRISMDIALTHDVEKLCSEPGEILRGVAAIGIKLVPGTGRMEPRAVMAVDLKKLEAILRKRIVDDTLVVEIPVMDPKEIIYVSGHDTSSWTVNINTAGLTQILRIPAVADEMYLLAGIRVDTWPDVRGREVRVQREITPRPESIGELKMREAVTRGYLIPPHIIEETEGRVQRLKEAAMNIIEYSLIEDALRGGSTRTSFDADKGPPPLPPRPIIHDGRLFPYEHRLDDFAGGYGSWHSRLVRISIYSFSRIIREVVGDPRLMILGVVKRAQAPYIHPLVVWLLYREDEDKFWKFINRTSLERWEATILLSRAAENAPHGSSVRTFGLLRHYWSMDAKLMDAFVYSARNTDEEFDPTFWLQRAKIPGELEPGLKDYLEVRGVERGADEVLAYVLANATVALTYVFPPGINPRSLVGSEVLLPRYELLVPPPRDEYLKYRINDALNSLAIPQIYIGRSKLFGYEILGIEDIDKRHNKLIVPLHISLADEYARHYDAVLKEMYLNSLILAIAKLLRETITT